MAENSLKEIMSFFGMSASAFMKEWKEMPAEGKAQIKEGIANGTLTY